MKFADVIKNEAQVKETENGAKAYDRLNSNLLTLFGQIGALRSRTVEEIEDKFAAAFAEDQLLATKMLFYCGNIRGGLGERRTFRICLKWLANHYPDIVEKNMQNIALFNRYDSLFELVNTPCEDVMWKYVKLMLNNDYSLMEQGRSCSLLAKWMPSENASSQKTKTLARKAIWAFGWPNSIYRKCLSELRAYIKVVERSMSANEWEDIEYSSVPSYAMARYSYAFSKHDEKRFAKYVADLNKGEEKVNASTLYPYDLVKGFLLYSVAKENPVAEQQWKALPNYIEGENNILVMADVSGSMMACGGRPMATSVGLALYFAERNKGDYHNCYMTFTDNPHFVNIDDSQTLRSKVRQVMRTDIGYNTNLEAAFDYILTQAQIHHIKPQDMPKALMVISDMEIDYYMRENGVDFVDEMKTRFEQNHLPFPKLIMWNVEARNDTFLSQSEDVVVVSGHSPSAFKSVLGAVDGLDAWDVMLDTLNNKMYDCVRI